MEIRVNVTERIDVGCDTSCHLRPVKISGTYSGGPFSIDSKRSWTMTPKITSVTMENNWSFDK